ncbi:MAG: LysR family transcriptional regulator [Burkholderia sp.]|nr:LysR family transcriptional regulator [Burkholderia sp.]
MAIDDEITLKKIEVFLAFMGMNNLARVSERLGLSAVSVHRALHSLEEGLRCPLFKREGRNLIPLKAAYVFAEHAQRAVDACEAGVKEARDVSGFNAPRLRIGSLYSLTLRCIPKIIIGLKLRKPTLDINLTLGSNRELLNALAEERLDAIIIGLKESPAGQDLVSVPLFNDLIYLAARVESPYAGVAEIDLDDVRDEKFVTLREGFVTSESFSQAFERSGFRPQIAMEVGDIFSLINLVSEGIGYSLLPGRIGAFSSRIQLIPLAEKYASHQQVTLMFPASRERDPNVLALAAECRIYGRQSAENGAGQ